jgi:hypothetical protein
MDAYDDGFPDECDCGDEVPGLFYPTHEQFAPARRFFDLRDDHALYAVYADAEETDVQADVLAEVRAVEEAGGMPLLVHIVDPVTGLHSFYVYARHDDPAQMRAWDEAAAEARPELAER